MKLDEVKEIRQTDKPFEVNDALKEGFVIMKIFSSKIPINDHGDMAIRPCYVMGR